MPPLSNLAYLGIGAVAIVVGILILRFVSSRASRSERSVSLSLGYSAIFSILTLWAFGFVSLGAGFGWNPNMLGQ